MSLFRDMIKSALDSDLSKNEYKAFLGLLHQTLGYGKASDNLTDNRLSTITGVRKDRLRIALDGVVASGLFDVKDHARFDYCYTFGLSFLASHSGTFFTPSLPKNRRNFRETEVVSENRVHTDTNPYQFNPTQPLANTETVAVDSDGICSESVAFDNDGICSESVAANHPEPCVGFALPEQIPKENKAVCQRLLGKLSLEQRNKALQVFSSMVVEGRVRKPAGLLITLAKAAKQGTLIVPETVSCSAPLHPSHIAISQQRTSSHDKAVEHSADLSFIQLQAKLQNKPLHEIAMFYGKQHLLKEVQHV